MTRLQFNEARHTYRLDGHWVPGVTGITNRTGDKGGLIGAAVKLTAAYALNHVDDLQVIDREVWLTAVEGAYRRAWDQARDDGTMLHAIAETMIDGHPMPTVVGDREVPAHVRDMAGQLARFYDAWDVEPRVVEGRGFNEAEQYAGTFDLVGDLAGTRWLIDYKTSQGGVWPESAMQVCAYERMTHYVDNGIDRDMSALGIERRGVLHIRPDHWELFPTRADDAMWQAFLHAAAAADFSRLHRRHSIGDPLPEPKVIER